jgi:hypothetical protein
MVKDFWGGNRVARGFIYTHYEFEDDKRWTDEDWKQLVYSPSDASELIGKEPSWYAKFRRQSAR